MVCYVSQNKPKDSKNDIPDIKNILFDIDTGYHFCSGTSKNGDINKYGIGLSLYFKFLKYITTCFCIFAVLTIPILILTFKSIFIF